MEIAADKLNALLAENESLRNANKRLRMLEAALHCSNEAVLIYSGDGQCIDFNAGAFSFLARAQNELLTLPIWEILPDILECHWYWHWNELALAGRLVHEGRLRVGTGQHIPVRITETLVHHEGVSYGCAVIRDASKQVEMEDRLLRDRSILENILSTIPYFVFWKDRTSRYLGANRAFTESAGLASPEEIVGKTDYDLPWRLEETEAYRADDAAIMASGTPRLHYEETQQQQDGTVITLETSKVPLRNRDGEVIGILGVYSDVTMRKEMELRLREYTHEMQAKNKELLELNEQAKAATQAKSEFLANMSHEIRTPMTAILGYSQILLESLADSEHRQALTTIARNGEHLLEVINDILDLSKIEQGKVELENIDCSPSEILTDVHALVRVRSSEKQLRFDVSCDGPIPKTIRTDPTRLRQILINLANNAVKFTDSGAVSIVMRLCERAGDAPLLQFDVSDSGIGMSEAQLHKLFTPFEQLDSSVTRRYGGTGLGLAISRRLAQALGGNIVVTSRPDEGSTFTLTVATGDLEGVERVTYQPVQPNFVTKPDALLTTHPLADLRVLLAEDGADNQRLIRHILRKQGASVTVVDNGQLAYERAMEAERSGVPFDVILMDMQMPILDGYTATRLLREAGYDRPIIALTAHAMSSDRDKCLNSGCDAYLTKPIDRSKLVYAVLSRSRAFSGAGDA